jgi:hypothetical protein
MFSPLMNLFFLAMASAPLRALARTPLNPFLVVRITKEAG